MTGLPARVAPAVRVVAALILVLVGAGPALMAPAAADPGGSYGDPAKAAQYWAEQSYDNNCVLMAVAGAVGQITGHMPSEQEMIELAQNTPSVAHDGKTVFSDVNNGELVNSLDTGPLLAHYGIHSRTAEDAKGDAALNLLETALGARHAVLVPVSSKTIWAGHGAKSSDHEVAVTGIDATDGVAHLNDSGIPDGRDLHVQLDTFMSAWGGGDFEMTVSQETVQ